MRAVRRAYVACTPARRLATLHTHARHQHVDSHHDTRRVVCTSLAQAHVQLSALLLQQQLLSRDAQATASPSPSDVRDAAAALLRVRAWWRAAQQRILVPRDVYAIDDMPLFLLEVVRGRQLPYTLAEQQRRCALAAHAWAAEGRGRRRQPHVHGLLPGDDDTSSSRSADELQRFMHMSEEAILREFDEWVCMNTPHDTLASLQQQQDDDDDDDDSRGARTDDVVPYTTMMSLVASYVRYHRGVRWGAGGSGASSATSSSSSSSLPHNNSASTTTSTAASYALHPFHQLYCPHGHAAQMPYVHVLQWMRDRDGSRHRRRHRLRSDGDGDGDGDATTHDTTAAQTYLWQQHRARRAFDAPHGFAALDLGCQSGYVADLLLKAGAAHITAMDTTPLPLVNTEATAREHVRCKRSSAAFERRVQVQQCDLLPIASPTQRTVAASRAHDRNNNNNSNSSNGAADAYASAAARRRQRARQLGRYGVVDESDVAYTSSSSNDAAAADDDDDSTTITTTTTMTSGAAALACDRSYDVLYIHPPPPVLLPVTCVLPRSRRPSTWWQHVHAVAGGDGMTAATTSHRLASPSQRPLLPFVVCDAAAATDNDAPQHPHSSMHCLQQIVQVLREDVTRRCPHDALHDTTTTASSSSSSLPCALLRDSGYVVLVLPRTFDVDELMSLLSSASSSSASSTMAYALSDWVVTQLDGLYDVVLRRRHRAYDDVDNDDNDATTSSKSSSSNGSHDATLWRHLLAHVQPHRQQQRVHAARASAWWHDVCTFMRTQMWTDVLVLQKRADVAHAHRARLLHGGGGGNSSSTAAAAASVLADATLQHGRDARRHHDDNDNSDAATLDDDDDDDPVSRAGVHWRDSFEYNEYKPRSTGAPTTLHWSDQVPSYSYLEADYWTAAEQASATRQFLAVGHPPQLQRQPIVDAHVTTTTTATVTASSSTAAATGNDGTTRAVADAAARFRGLFDAELRARRRTRIRKTALASHRQQEWMIDEKLVRSSAAKIEFMNELARWDLQEPD